MKTASELRELSKANQQIIDTRHLEEIDQKMLQSASKGYTFCIIEKNVSQNVKELLEAKGFTVNQLSNSCNIRITW